MATYLTINLESATRILSPLRVEGLTGHYGKYLFAANRVSIINIAEVFTRLMHKWQLKMQEMFIRGEWKESASGLWKANTFMRAVRTKLHNCMNLQMIKFTGIRLFMICRMRLRIC